MANCRGRLGVLVTLLTLGQLAAPALAGPTARVRTIPGEVVSLFDNGRVHGIGVQIDKAAAREAASNLSLPYLPLYDNLPTILGGTADPGVFGPGSAAGTFAFVDWTAPPIAWGDDLHGVADGPFGGLLTNLRYAYRNSIATSTHVIKIYEMVPPSSAHPTFFTAQKGPLVTQLTLPGMPPAPTGVNLTTVPGLNVPLPPGSSFWIEFHESGPGFPGTFWLTGGLPGVGSSHNGVTYTYTGGYYPPPGYNRFYGAPYLYFPGPPVRYVGSNVSVALHGPPIYEGGYPCDNSAAIPDNTPSGVSIPITVPDFFSWDDLDLRLDVTHTWIGDLIVDLMSPMGTTVRLVDRPGEPASSFGCSSNNVRVFLDDEGLDGPVEDLCAASNIDPTPEDGRHTPNNPLSAFDGESPQGVWTLTISDNAAGDTGTLDSCTLCFNGSCVPLIFADGFESGDVSRWSSNVSGP